MVITESEDIERIIAVFSKIKVERDAVDEDETYESEVVFLQGSTRPNRTAPATLRDVALSVAGVKNEI